MTRPFSNESNSRDDEECSTLNGELQQPIMKQTKDMDRDFTLKKKIKRMSNKHLKSQSTSQTGGKWEPRGPQWDTPTSPAKTGEIKKKKRPSPGLGRMWNNWNSQSCWWERKMRRCFGKWLGTLVKLNTASHMTQITRVLTHEKWDHLCSHKTWIWMLVLA